MNNIEERFKDIDGLLAIITVFSLITLVFMVLETFWDRKTGRRNNLKETFANIAISIGNSLLELTVYGSVFIVALWGVEHFAMMKIKWSWQSWALALLAADFSYYWMHRLEHEIRFFWSFHSVHHSSPEFNLSTAHRLAWVESLFEWIFLVPMVLIGFDIVQTLGAFLSVVVYQSWIHTDKIKSLGWLDVILNTPSPHRVHHSRDEKYLDKNYGGIFLIWDHLFKTYQKEEETPNYGLVTQINSANPFVINFFESKEILTDILKASNLSEIGHYMFGRPGWKPEKMKVKKEDVL